MANQDHLARLRQGGGAWNAWRETAPKIPPDLSGANLSNADLSEADFSEAKNYSRADLSGANLHGANLSNADLSEADLSGADLAGAILNWANLIDADLSGANLNWASLSEADLSGADLSGAVLGIARPLGADLSGANLQDAVLFDTLFISVNFAKARGLDHCRHLGPSTVDHRTLQQSGPLPLEFLRGCGLPENWIEYLPSLLNQPIQHYSCFISYSSKDRDFADRLHADLQNKGVRCWFAPHDLPIGAKTWDAIDAAIKLRDKLLLILSENSIASDWVEDEVGKAFAEERGRKINVLFPVRIDDVVMTTTEAWAVKLRDQRVIGDFRKWKEHDGYGKSLERLLRDLKMPDNKPSA
jgi:hypothetical protein